MSEEIVIKCKYAGDPEDVYCAVCDGYKVNPDDGTEPFLAVNCSGYEPATPEPGAPKEVQQNEKAEKPPEKARDEQIAKEEGTNTSVAVTTVIRAESGLSAEINGKWFKFSYAEERTVPEGADIAAEKKALWDAVNAQVDAQYEDVRNG